MDIFDKKKAVELICISRNMLLNNYDYSKISEKLIELEKEIYKLPDPPMSKEEAKEAAFEYAKQFDATRILIVDGCYQVSCFNINGIWEEKEVFPFEY